MAHALEARLIQIVARTVAAIHELAARELAEALGRGGASPAAARPGRARRSSAQRVRDENRILAVIKAHPGSRSLDIQKHLSMPRDKIADGLERLRIDRKVRITGKRSATAYTAI